MLLLLVAEFPLVVFTVLLTRQNDRLRSDDALSQATNLQHSLLLETNRELRIAALLAVASASLPGNLLTSPDDCRAVLHTLIAPDADYIEQAVLISPDGTQICASDLAIGAALMPPDIAAALLKTHRQLDIQVRGGALELSRQFTTDDPQMGIAGRETGGAVILRLRNRSSATIPAASPPSSLWLVSDNHWQPIAGALLGEQPGSPVHSLLSTELPTRMVSQDGRDFLYAATSVDALLSTTGATLVAASDVRAAAKQTQGLFFVRLTEMAAFFTAEFMLIVAGIQQVITQPLRQLSASVRVWQQSGRFDSRGTSHDPVELRELTASFAQATHALTVREQELQTATAQQDLLMKEIHHRVKNNLQIIASLLNLQASRIKGPEARAEFQSARDRVRALATLHRHLYGDGDLHMVDLRAFFAELCSQLFQALGEAEGDRINLRVTAPDINITSDQAVPIALIVTETVGNAIKFAFPGDRRGTITVNFQEGADDAGTLLVCDDGVGFTSPPPHNAREGLGLQLIRGFARQLGASLVVTHELGTCYRVVMKLERRSRADRKMPDSTHSVAV